MGWSWVNSIDEQGRQCRSLANTTTGLNQRLEFAPEGVPVWQVHELPEL